MADTIRSNFVFMQCGNPACSFRFPVQYRSLDVVEMKCPLCKSMAYANISPLPHLYHPKREIPQTNIFLEAILDNLRSVFNVGSIFRTSDGCGFNHLYLCGTTPTPLHPKMQKTALGAEKFVSWSYHPNAVELAERLVNDGKEIWAIEDSPYSESIETLQIKYFKPIVLIVGNELAGIDPSLLDRCTRIISIPMHGQKRSLNVEVAFSIAAYCIRRLLLSAEQ